ncbi:hypothetical protein TNCV_1342811 [Trichonephila clavipes]|nr:hypothetical protein TNCV_1342811 [Trichonephila clavipes]
MENGFRNSESRSDGEDNIRAQVTFIYFPHHTNQKKYFPSLNNEFGSIKTYRVACQMHDKSVEPHRSHVSLMGNLVDGSLSFDDISSLVRTSNLQNPLSIAIVYLPSASENIRYQLASCIFEVYQ